MLEKFFIPFCGSLLVVTAMCGGLYLSSPSTFDETLSPPWIQSAEAGPIATWRHTAEGWQDSAVWRADGEEVRVRFVDRIHPVTWTIGVVLLAIGAAVLVSDEWNVRRLWARSTRKSALP